MKRIAGWLLGVLLLFGSVGVVASAEAAEAVTIRLGLGERYAVTVQQDDWTSTNPNVAVVQNGEIVTLARGTATVTIGQTKVYAVRVYPAPQSITLTPKTALLYTGQSVSLSYAVPSGSCSAVTLTSSAPKIASVSGKKLTARRAGTATVEARTFNGKKAVCKVTVVDRPTKIAFSAKSYTVNLKSQKQLKVTADRGGAKVSYTYTSSNPSVVSVGKRSGLVAAKKAGRVTITAVSDTGKRATCTVSVRCPTKVTLNAVSKTLGVGASYVLRGKANVNPTKMTYTYTSSNPKVVSVNRKTGKMTAKKTGTATITCKINTGKKATCKVTVKKAPAKVTLSATTKVLRVKQSTTLTASVPSGAWKGTVTYTSSNPKAATVNKNGKVTALRTGSTTITARTYNGKKATCTVIVRLVNYTQAYRSYAAVQKDIYALGDTYPNVVKVYTIGKSAKGKDITMLTIGTGKKKALVVGGMHAREHISVTFSMRCAEEYVRAYVSSSGKYGSYDMKKLLKKYTLYLVPCCNPDGLDIVNGAKPLFTNKKQSASLYKRNANGVNLNRNFPFCWDRVSGTTEPAHPEEGYKGRSAGSEPETKALMNLCACYRFDWMFSMHCMGNMVYWRDAVNRSIPGSEKLANRLRDTCGYYKMGTSTDYALFGGGFENWFRYTYRKPGFCVELVPGGRGFDFNRSSDYTRFNTVTNFSKTRYTWIQGML